MELGRFYQNQRRIGRYNKMRSLFFYIEGIGFFGLKGENLRIGGYVSFFVQQSHLVYKHNFSQYGGCFCDYTKLNCNNTRTIEWLWVG